MLETLTGPTDDGAALPPTHAALAAKDVLPSVQVIDTDYTDSKLLVVSWQQYGVDLVGPPRRDQHWQAQASEGFAADQITIDWDRGLASCAAGRTSQDWRPAIDGRDDHVVKICFASTDCGPCTHRAACTTSASHRRTVTIRLRAQYEALHVARQREGTREHCRDYDQRAGIEGTLSYGGCGC